VVVKTVRLEKEFSARLIDSHAGDACQRRQQVENHRHDAPPYPPLPISSPRDAAGGPDGDLDEAERPLSQLAGSVSDGYSAG